VDFTRTSRRYGRAFTGDALEFLKGLPEGSVDLVIKAGDSAGDPVEIQVRPDGSSLEIDNRLDTVAETGTGMLTMERLPGSLHLTVRGQIPAKAAPFVRTASVDNPTQFFADAFRRALEVHPSLAAVRANLQAALTEVVRYN